MIIKDSKRNPKDDYTNIHELEKMRVISSGSAKLLAESNGLRNALVHRYNTVDDVHLSKLYKIS